MMLIICNLHMEDCSLNIVFLNSKKLFSPQRFNIAKYTYQFFQNDQEQFEQVGHRIQQNLHKNILLQIWKHQ